MEAWSVTCSEGNGKAVYTGWNWGGIAAYSGSFQTPAALPLRDSELSGMIGRVSGRMAVSVLWIHQVFSVRQ